MAEQLSNQIKGGGSIPTSPLQFGVRQIPYWHTFEWLRNKHYAKRVPQIMYAYGLYNMSQLLVGVCTYGNPQRNLNAGCFRTITDIPCLELNRLVVDEQLPKNTLSVFVSRTFKLLPKPMCLVSYSDSAQGHHGYIYQATNWLYTGERKPDYIYINTLTKEEYHGRTVYDLFGSRSMAALPSHIIAEKERGGKHRYLMFLGNKQEVHKMVQDLRFECYPYPKGDNRRYDASYEPNKQGVLI